MEAKAATSRWTLQRLQIRRDIVNRKRLNSGKSEGKMRQRVCKADKRVCCEEMVPLMKQRKMSQNALK
jgi:hypothetical protein